MARPPQAAKQYVRSVFIVHTRVPLGRIAKQLNKVTIRVRKAYRNGA